MPDLEWDPFDGAAAALPLRAEGHGTVTILGDLFRPSADEGAVDRVFCVMALCPDTAFRGVTAHGDRMWAEASGRALRVGATLMGHATGHVGAQCHVIGIVHGMTFGGLPNVAIEEARGGASGHPQPVDQLAPALRVEAPDAPG